MDGDLHVKIYKHSFGLSGLVPWLFRVCCPCRVDLLTTNVHTELHDWNHRGSGLAWGKSWGEGESDLVPPSSPFYAFFHALFSMLFSYPSTVLHGPFWAADTVWELQRKPRACPGGPWSLEAWLQFHETLMAGQDTNWTVGASASNPNSDMLFQGLLKFSRRGNFSWGRSRSSIQTLSLIVWATPGNYMQFNTNQLGHCYLLDVGPKASS